MKSLYSIFIIILLIFIVYLNGCDIITKHPETGKGPTGVGTNLIISEVFTLSPDKYYDYSWIEVYNPSTISFNWYNVERPSVGVTVGEDGTIRYTDNSGVNWQIVTSPNQRKFNAVSFSLPDSGIIVGDSSALVSLKKSGDAWITRQLAAPDPMRKNIRDVTLSFQSKYGILVGDSGLIMRTLDRGQTWLSFAKKRVRYSLNSVWFQNPRIYAVGDSGTLLKSSGSSTFDQKPLPEVIPATTNFYSCKFLTDSIGYVIGQYGVILKTVNIGETWGYKTSGVTSTLRSIFVSGSSTAFNTDAWVVGDDGVILKSTDGGDRWVKQTSGVTTTLRNVAFSDSIHGFAFGDQGIILATKDGGITWTGQESNASVSLRGSFFNYPDIGVTNLYALEMWGVRKHFLSNVVLAAPEATIVNYDYITKVDTGIVLFDPSLLASLPQLWYNYIFLKTGRYFPIPSKLSGIFGFKDVPSVSPGAFTIINSDSNKFSDHTKLGPGTVNVVNASIGYLYDTSKAFGIDWFKWNLLPSSEIRLVVYQIKQNNNTGEVLGYAKKTIDVVRWGNFAPSVWYVATDSLYPENKAAGYIPEWYSLTRYSDDFGNSDLSKLNTSSSFYMAKDPLPGWYSQKKKQ